MSPGLSVHFMGVVIAWHGLASANGCSSSVKLRIRRSTQRRMPIDAQEWRIKTGLVNSNRHLKVVHSGFRSHCSLGVTRRLPPPAWKGWGALFIMLTVPLFYKITTVAIQVGITLWFGHTRTGGYEGKFNLLIANCRSSRALASYPGRLRYMYWLANMLVGRVIKIITSVMQGLFGASLSWESPTGTHALWRKAILKRFADKLSDHQRPLKLPPVVYSSKFISIP